MSASTSNPPAQFFVSCGMNFPKCFNGAYPSGQAVLSTACACHVAREAAAAVLPKVTIKSDTAAEPPQGSATNA